MNNRVYIHQTGGKKSIIQFIYRAEELPVTIALGTLNYLDKEMDHVPWAAATRELAYVNDMLSKTETFGDFQVNLYIKGK